MEKETKKWWIITQTSCGRSEDGYPYASTHIFRFFADMKEMGREVPKLVYYGEPVPDEKNFLRQMRGRINFRRYVSFINERAKGAQAFTSNQHRIKDIQISNCNYQIVCLNQNGTEDTFSAQWVLRAVIKCLNGRTSHLK